MLKKIGDKCDYCNRPIPKKVDTCSTCIHNRRELQKDPRLQELKLDHYVLENVLDFELPGNLELDTNQFEGTFIETESEEEFREELEELFREMFGPDDSNVDDSGDGG